MSFSSKEKRYRQLINETADREQYIYLTVHCSTRSKHTASRAKTLINAGDYAAALKLADPIAYQCGLNDQR